MKFFCTLIFIAGSLSLYSQSVDSLKNAPYIRFIKEKYQIINNENPDSLFKCSYNIGPDCDDVYEEEDFTDYHCTEFSYIRTKKGNLCMIELQESAPDRIRRAKYFFIDSSLVYEENYSEAHIYPEFFETIYKKDSILYEYSSKPSYNADIGQLISTSYEVKKTEKKTDLTTIPGNWIRTGSDLYFNLCDR